MMMVKLRQTILYVIYGSSFLIILFQLYAQNKPMSQQQERDTDHVYIQLPRNNNTKPEIKISSTDCENVLGTPTSIKNTSSFLNVTCRALLHTTDINKPVFQIAKDFQKKNVIPKISDQEFIQLTNDCKKFRVSHNYHLKPVNQEEEDFPIAFNILTHKDVQQVEFLLRAIYRPQNVYCIHVDNKQSAVFKAAVNALAGCFHNVYIASKPEHIVYAGFSRLQADINCMQDQLKHPVNWRYLLNIAAQSFPLKTNLEMVRILKVYNGSNDIEGITGKRIIKARFETEWKEFIDGPNATGIKQTGKKNTPSPNNITIVRGSAYGIFSRDFVNFIISDENAKALLNWSRNTYTPDEHYWATLHHTYSNRHLHTPGGYDGHPDSKPWLAVFVAWGGENPCHGQWVRGCCVYGVQDLPLLVSRHEFFANKFYYDYQPLSLECLNNWIEYKVTCQPPLDMEYFEKLKFINKGI